MALRESQLALLRGELNPDDPTRFQHPYFWAPFFLIGEAGVL
jgi:CHAT domain-containing protein